MKSLSDIVLSQDLNVITAEINSYKQVAGQAIFEIGRRLKWAKENDLVHGEFGKWLENIDLNHRVANQMMKVASELPNSSMYSKLSSRVLYEIATMPEEERDNSYTIPSTGENKKVDEMTVKELREVKSELKRIEQERDQLGELLQQERSKPPTTKTVEKIVDNTDYNRINQLQQQLSKVEQQKQLLDQKIKLEEQDAAEYRKLKSEIQHLHSEKNDLHRQIESATSISGLVVEIEHLLQNKLAPVKYSRAIQEQRGNEVVVKNLKEIIDSVFTWCTEMEDLLPKSKLNKNYIDAEVIEYEG